MVRKKLRAFALKKIAMITEDSIRKSSLAGCSHPLKGWLNRLGEARAWDYKQYQRKNNKFVFGADQNRLLSSVG